MSYIMKKISIIIFGLVIQISLLFSQSGFELHFDGEDDYVDLDTIANEMKTVNDWAFSAWVKPEKDAFRHTNVYYLAINCDNGNANCNKILFGIRTEDGKPFIWEKPDGSESEGFVLTSETAINDGKWNHLVYSRTASTGTLYLNGASIGTHTVKHAAFVASDKWSLGQEFDGANVTNEYVGLIDDVTVWSEDLSADEVITVYNSGSGLNVLEDYGNYKSSSDIKAFWTMDDGKGTKLTDASVGGYTATIVGPSWRVINSLTFNPDTINTKNSEASVLVKMGLVNSLSNSRGGNIVLISPSALHTAGVSLNISDTLSTGEVVLSGTVKFPRYVEKGDWYIRNMAAYDSVYNKIEWYRSSNDVNSSSYMPKPYRDMFINVISISDSVAPLLNPLKSSIAPILTKTDASASFVFIVSGLNVRELITGATLSDIEITLINISR